MTTPAPSDNTLPPKSLKIQRFLYTRFLAVDPAPRIGRFLSDFAVGAESHKSAKIEFSFPKIFALFISSLHHFEPF